MFYNILFITVYEFYIIVRLKMIDVMSVLGLVLSLLGNLLINFRKKSGYVVWIIANILWVLVNIFGNCNIPQVIMYSVYTILNIHGIISWSKSNK